MRLRRHTHTHPSRALTGVVVGAVAVLALSACTGSAEDAENDADDGDTPAASAPAGSNDEEGDTVTIGFSAPAADHGWMGAITNNVRDMAEQYPDIDLQVAEGTNDVNLQISQVETFINDGVDAIVLLPFDGAAMTPVALQAMEAGIPVINVDREFDDPNAARVTVLGDNYGMGVSAGPVHVRAVRQTSPTPSSPRSRASTRSRSPRTAARASRTRSVSAISRSPTGSPPTSPSRVARKRQPSFSRQLRRSTASGTTTTTRAWASWPPSRTPAATSSSWSAVPDRPTPCVRSRRMTAS